MPKHQLWHFGKRYSGAYAVLASYYLSTNEGWDVYHIFLFGEHEASS